jgi:hypothetical protein
MPARMQSGVYTLQAFICDDNDFPMGTLTTPNSPTNGTVYGGYILKSTVSYTAAADTVETAQAFGNQKLLGRRELGPSEFGDGTLETAEFDPTFDALVQGYVLDTTTGTGLEIAGHNVNRAASRKLMLAFTPAATPSNGTPNFDTIFTWGTLRRSSLGSGQQAGRNPNNRVYTLTKLLSTRTPWGQLFSQSTLNPSSGKDDEVIIYADAPMELFTIVRDGTASGYATPYALTYTAVAANGSANLIYMNGTASAQLVAGAISGGTAILLGNAGVSAQKVIVVGPSVPLLNAS